MTETTYNGDTHESNDVWHSGHGSYYYYGYLYSGSAPGSHIPSGSAPSSPSAYGSITIAGIPLNYNGNPNFTNYAFIDPEAILNEKYPKPPEPVTPDPTEPPAIIATPNLPIANDANQASNISNLLDWFQEGLSWAGMAPRVGAAPDIVNTGIYLLRGNFKEAGFSAIAVVPIIGDATSGRRSRKRQRKIS
jgi:hypothetical protein